MAGVGFSGKNGDVKIGTTAICEIKGWSFNPKSNNPRYASNKTGGYKRTVAGIKEGSGSMSGVYDTTTPHVSVIDVGTDVTLKLYLDGTYFFSVPSVIDDYKVNVDIDTGEIVSWEATFSTNGAWTNPTAPMMAPLTAPAEAQVAGINVADVKAVGAYNADVFKQVGLLDGVQKEDILKVAKEAMLDVLREALASGALKMDSGPSVNTTGTAKKPTVGGDPSIAPDKAATMTLGENEGEVKL